MSLNIFKKIFTGLNLVPNSTNTTSEKGDLQVIDGTGDLVYHNGSSSSVVQTADSSGTLKNKKLEDTTVYFVDAVDDTKQIRFDCGGTASTRTTIAASQTTNRTISLPDATDTVAVLATAQTFTNKTIDADANSITNIDNADIKSGANIARNKLASGSANHVLINDDSGVISSEATLAKSRGGSGQDNSSITFPASGTLATLAGTETFTNKTLTSPIINTPTIDIQNLTEQVSAPSSPSAGTLKLYAKTDDLLYIKDSSGTESQILTSAVVAPTGMMAPYGGSSAPSGWLLCDGTAVSRTTYSALFAVVGTAFGVGDGSTTFNIPNMERRVPMGAGGSGTGTIGNAVGDVGGEEDHLLTGAESGTSVHTHGITDPGHLHSVELRSAGGGGAPIQGTTASTLIPFNSGSSVTGITVNNSSAASASSAHNTVQPSIIFNYIIKT